MKKALVVLAAFGALAATGAAYSSLASGGPSDDPFVAGGGRLGPGCFDLNTSFCFAAPRDLGVDAHLEKQGERVTGVLTYGNNAGVLRAVVDVTCASIVGNRAAIGGVIRESGDAAFVGFGALLFVHDLGSPGQPTRDRSSPLFSDTLSSTGWPTGFPYTCPGPDDPINNIGFQALHSGDIVISEGED